VVRVLLFDPAEGEEQAATAAFFPAKAREAFWRARRLAPSV